MTFKDKSDARYYFVNYNFYKYVHKLKLADTLTFSIVCGLCVNLFQVIFLNLRDSERGEELYEKTKKLL